MRQRTQICALTLISGAAPAAVQIGGSRSYLAEVPATFGDYPDLAIGRGLLCA